MPRVNLSRLNAKTPGASRAVAWTSEEREVEVPELSDGNRKAAAALPKGAAAFGVVWPIAHVADGAEVFFAGKPPAAKSLRPEAFDGERWVTVKQDLAVEAAGASVRLTFEPIATRKLRVAFEGPGRKVAELAVYAYTPRKRGGRTSWPERIVGRGLTEDLLSRKAEPSFEALSLHGLPMPIWATMGIKDWPHEQAVHWDGRILLQGFFDVVCSVGRPPQGFADVRDTVRRGLIDGWLPGVITEGQFGQVHVKQTALVTFTTADDRKSGLFIRYDVRNVSDRPCKTAVHVKLDWGRRKMTTAFRDRSLRRAKALYLTCSAPCRSGGTNTIAWDVELPPGQTASATFAAPVNSRGGVSRPISEHLPNVTFEAALKRFRAYWKRNLAGAMRIDLPEPRLNNLHRAVLTQLLINADGDVMPYGCAPSAYNGALYGLEEGYAMLLLGMSGLGADAQRYMDGTYLTRSFLKKVEKYRVYAHRHQQYRNGLQPMYAVELYRLTRDRKWISRHLPLFRECAEWTFANRRKSLAEPGDEPPLHRGLLEKWSYGGDLAARQCYPLYANYACWRGLHETAWLMAELGDAATARRYRAEADEYHKQIMAVIDAIYLADAKPPVLPATVYAKGATGGEYYQLFAGCSLDLLPFPFDDKRADYLGDYLAASNRTFCMLPRFRRDVGPGGLDAIYGLGHILTKLHQDRTAKFLLGFYAFCVFNLEHTCFSSRETNAVYAADAHLRTDFRVPAMSDPLPCSSAVAGLLLRHMLVTEECLGAGEYTGRLWLLRGAPRKWFEPGKTIAVTGARTHFGTVSFRVASKVDKGVLEAEVVSPKRNAPEAIVIRLRHPDGKKMKSVTVNGSRHSGFDARTETVTISKPEGRYSIVARY